MDTVDIQTIASLLGLLSVWLIFWIIRSAVPKYLDTKAQNFATKEDIGRITELQEAVKLEFAKQLEEIRAQIVARNEQLKASLASGRYWEEEYQRIVASKVDALFMAYADALRWSRLIERVRWAVNADLMAADKDYIDSIFRIITNVQILSALGAVDNKLAQSIYGACHAHRDAWDAYTQIIEEARAHYWNQEAVSVDIRDSYERRLAEKARGLHQPGFELDRVIVELGKSLVTRRRE